MTFKFFVGEFLSLIERQEARLLSWGFYGSSFDADQAQEWLDAGSQELQLAWEGFKESGETIESLLERLALESLLFEIPSRPGQYRSRFAEGIRLLASLRQLFPHRLWTVAPRLVSDLRVDLRARLYPRRDIPVEVCWERLKSLVDPAHANLLKDCFLRLSHSGAGPMDFAGFQDRAFSHIYASYGTSRQSGSIVSAGTGSGKTKAFYVPAFLRIAEDISRDASAFTKVIAIYPRTVLLADQLREALSEADKMSPALHAKGLRNITFGALLGDTPNKSDFDNVMVGSSKLWAEVRHWIKTKDGFIVPFTKSPSNPQKGLLWRNEDRRAGRTILHRDGSDGQVDVFDGVLRLTREELQAHPPDVLFVSSEMLNRELGNPAWSKTFGIGVKDRAPRLLLLDEVHTYQGVTGAQTGWLLRRWRHWARNKRVHYVGLSATLADAPTHLARVCGIPVSSISEFKPVFAEMVSEGIEYNVAVKGNPAGASVLATTIQTGMLLTRLLATPSGLSAGEDEIHGNAFWGRKTFGFTDILDTLNRWLSDMKDAERKHLPQLRASIVGMATTEVDRLRADGQLWELSTQIGHNLASSLRISGCSSQRPGLNASSDLVIATSSLEVGFDDPEVGAIIHHKRPSSMASFVQRKGRAGRRRGMRPWTVVVLSDYGADRFAFQNSEQLFSPEIRNLFLPSRNAYVLRQQAVYYLLEWLGFQLRNFSPFDLRPGRTPAHIRRSASMFLRELIDGGPAFHRFRQDFERFLCDPSAGDYSLTALDVDAVFWNEPKPLLYEVVPSLLRKLESDWGLAQPGKESLREDAQFKRPLPTFIPGATFGQLDVAEATIQFLNSAKEDETMGVPQALIEFCPGRVSKRYSVRDGESGYWLHASSRLINDDIEWSVASVFDSAVLIDQISIDSPLNIYQPIVFPVKAHDSSVTERSNGFWQWTSRLQEFGSSRPLPMRRSGTWGNAVNGAQMHLHRENSGVDVLRYAEEWSFDLQLARQKGQTKSGIGTLSTQDDEETVREALGFRLKADGLLWTVSTEFLQNLQHPAAHQLNGLRSHYYVHCLRTSELLSGHIDRFSAEWLQKTSLAMLTATALRNNCSLANAQVLLRDRRVDALNRVLSQIIPVSSDDDSSPTAPAKLRDKLLVLWSTPVVREEVERLEQVLWNIEISPELFDWCKRRALSALAQAFQASALVSTDGVSEDDLSLDLVWDGKADARIYLVESASGGLGHVEALVRAIVETPEAFPEGVRQALHFCPREQLAGSLFAFLKALNEEDEAGPLRTAVSKIRVAADFKSAEIASEELRQALSISGLDQSRSFVVAILARIIRPGSTFETDRIAYLVNALWRRRSDRLGVDIDASVWAYVCSSSKSASRRFSAILQNLSGGAPTAPGQVYRLIQQMIVEGCQHSCPECLADTNRFNDAGLASRELASYWLGIRPPQIFVGNAMIWKNELRSALRQSGIAELVSGNADIISAMQDLQQLLAEELEVDSVLVPATITAMRRRAASWVIQVQLKGVIA
jgi:hypothetical protein